MTRLVLIRHGATEWNSQARYCGRKDVGLSDEGRFQSERLRKRLKKVKFDRVYSSDRKRAIESAKILFGRAKVNRDRSLREIDFGVLEGLRHEEIMEKYGDIYKKWLADPFKNRIPKAEPMDIFKTRVERGIRRIIRLNSDRIIAVVCHGGVIGMYLNSILKSKNFWDCIPSSASITVVEYRGALPRLKKFNDTRHLEVNPVRKTGLSNGVNDG